MTISCTKMSKENKKTHAKRRWHVPKKQYLKKNLKHNHKNNLKHNLLSTDHHQLNKLSE